MDKTNVILKVSGGGGGGGGGGRAGRASIIGLNATVNHMACRAHNKASSLTGHLVAIFLTQAPVNIFDLSHNCWNLSDD